MIDYKFGVYLDKIDPEDSPTLRRWRNDHRIWKWCRQNDLRSAQEHDRWFKKQAEDSSIKMYAIFIPFREPANYLSEEHRDYIVGVCGLTSIDPTNRTAEFSLYISPDYQHRGLAKAALKTLITHGFMNLGLNCIWGETFEGNKAAHLFEKIGFKKEGTRRSLYFREGKFIDAHLYSILASEWKCSMSDTSLAS